MQKVLYTESELSINEANDGAQRRLRVVGEIFSCSLSQITPDRNSKS